MRQEQEGQVIADGPRVAAVGEVDARPRAVDDQPGRLGDQTREAERGQRDQHGTGEEPASRGRGGITVSLLREVGHGRVGVRSAQTTVVPRARCGSIERRATPAATDDLVDQAQVTVDMLALGPFAHPPAESAGGQLVAEARRRGRSGAGRNSSPSVR